MARSEARRYRRRGLDATSRRIVEYITAQGIEGRTVLEVGGGIGAVQIELLKAGAARARSVELTPTYEEVATVLLREQGLEDRVERSVLDFAMGSTAVEAADIVIMNRVVCCYPDMPLLAGAGAEHARELFVLSYPRRSWWIRFALGFANLMLWLTRRQFKIFAHPPAQILATSEGHGLRTVLNERGLLWTVAALRRPSPA
jgi:hypothetical protein